MKTFFLKPILTSLILAILLFACQKEKVCNMDNPKQDLPWLKKMIDDYEYAAKTGAKMHVRIYQCTYSDGIGFLIDYCVGCPDFGYLLVNCEGESLCVLWGVTGNPCSEYNIDFKKKRLIWSKRKLK